MVLRTVLGALRPLVPPNPASRLVGVEVHVGDCALRLAALAAVLEDLTLGVSEALDDDRTMLAVLAAAVGDEVAALQLVLKELGPIRRDLLR